MSDTKITSDKLFDNVKKDQTGLIPCIVQDADDGAVLMVAYMNEDSLRKTIQDKKACFWSRSRNKFWLKGEESGNVQEVKEVYIDCDGDCVLIKVKQIGGAACHTGMRSCFFRKVDGEKLVTVGEKVFDPAKVYKK